MNYLMPGCCGCYYCQDGKCNNYLECNDQECLEPVMFCPDGVHELDPCEYEILDRYEDCIVEIMRWTVCGKEEIVWHRKK